MIFIQDDVYILWRGPQTTIVSNLPLSDLLFSPFCFSLSFVHLLFFCFVLVFCFFDNKYRSAADIGKRLSDQTDTAILQASPVAGPRGSSVESGLEPREQLDRFWRRGL